MSQVLVVDANKRQLNPVHPARARKLLSAGKAAIYRRYPFIIILKVAIEAPVVSELRIKLDPSSETTGIAVVDETSGKVVLAAELSHRGHQIKESLASRRAIRRSRRNRKTRYRAARWQNRRRKAGWLPPSLQSRISNILTWVQRLRRFCHITAISMELVRFDMQLMENPEISGTEYQQGTLAGYEVREYLLEKWGRKCVYCSSENVPLQVEHIVPRAKGGTNRISNLCLACEKCNLAKGVRDINEFLKRKPEVLKRVLAQARAPLKDAAAVSATRWALFEQLKETGLPVECGSGGLTKYNRSMRELPKTHWLDAACVGKSTPDVLRVAGVRPLLITAIGHGCRQVRNVNKFGFPRDNAKQSGRIHGFKTGDIVRASVTSGKKVGTSTGRVLVRASGSFDMSTKKGRIGGIGHRFCVALHRSEGYTYARSPQPNQPERKAHSSPA